ITGQGNFRADAGCIVRETAWPKHPHSGCKAQRCFFGQRPAARDILLESELAYAALPSTIRPAAVRRQSHTCRQWQARCGGDDMISRTAARAQVEVIELMPSEGQILKLGSKIERGIRRRTCRT